MYSSSTVPSTVEDDRRFVQAVASRHPNTLGVQIIALAFGPGKEAELTFRTALALDPTALCCAVVPSDAVIGIRERWNPSTDARLLIVHAEPGRALSTALQILELQSPGPLAILVAGPPNGQRKLLSFGKPNWIDQIKRARLDVQIHVCEPSWSTRPPRIR